MLDNTLKRDLTVEASSSRIRRSRLRERILLATFDLTAAVCSSLGAWWVWSRLLDRELLPWHPATLVVLTLSWAIVLASSRKLNSRLRRSILDDLPTVLGRILVASMVVALGTVLIGIGPERTGYNAGLVVLAAGLGIRRGSRSPGATTRSRSSPATPTCSPRRARGPSASSGRPFASGGGTARG